MSDSRFAWLERLFAVQATEKEMRRRGRLLSMALLSVMLFGVLLSFVYVAGWLTTGSAEYLIYLANDLLALIMLAALFYINRRGHVKPAGFGFSLLLIATVTVFFRDGPLDYFLAAYAVPVLAASFLVTPPSSFLQATLAVLSYSLVYSLSLTQEYNYISVFALYAVAAVAWVAASQLENALRSAADLFDRIPVGLYRVDQQGRVLDANPALAEILGYENVEALLGVNAAEIHVEERQRIEWDEAVARAGAYDGELALRRRDGAAIVVHVSVRTVRDAKGPIGSHEGHVEEITERKQAEAQLRRQADEFETLYEITRDLAVRRDLPDVLDSIARHAQRLLAAASSHVFLYDEARSDLELVVSWAQSPPVGVRLALGEGMAGRVALTRQPLIVDDYRAWPGRSPQLTDAANSAVAQVPLLYGGELIGVLGVGELGPTTRRFTDEDIRLLILLAGQAAAAVYNARLFAATSRQAAEMALLNRISLAISAGLELAPTLKALYEQCQQVLPVDCFSVALYDPSSGLIRFPFFHDGERDLALPPQDVHARPGLTGAVIKRRQTLYVSDVLDPDATRNLQVIHAGGHPTRSYVGVPLILRDEIIGVLSMQSYQPNAYTTEHIHLLETIAGQAAVAVENARLYDETRRYAAELEQRVVERRWTSGGANSWSMSLTSCARRSPTSSPTWICWSGATRSAVRTT